MGGRRELRERAGGVEDEVHVPVVLRRVFGLTYPTDVRFSHISSRNVLHRTLMCSHVVLTSCSVSVNVVCVSPCVQGRAVSLSLVEMGCVGECVACHWVSSGVIGRWYVGG